MRGTAGNRGLTAERSGLACFCGGLRAAGKISRSLNGLLYDLYGINHITVSDEQIEREPGDLFGRAIEASVVGTVSPKAIRDENSKSRGYQGRGAEPPHEHNVVTTE
ncbi:hypothetical protein D3C81_829130 [compost metagenome]